MLRLDDLTLLACLYKGRNFEREKNEGSRCICTIEDYMCAKGFYRPNNVDNRTAECVEDKDYLDDLCNIEDGIPQKPYEKISNNVCKAYVDCVATLPPIPSPLSPLPFLSAACKA